MDNIGFETLKASVILFLPRLLSAVIILIIFWLLGRLVTRIVGSTLKLRRISPDLGNLAGKVCGIVVIVFGLVTALGTIGIDTGAMIAGLGLSGFALGFALKDAISNFLAGFMLLANEPFRRGDLIRVADHQGRVLEVNLRYTVLETDNQRILIPNANLLTNAVVIDKCV